MSKKNASVTEPELPTVNVVDPGVDLDALEKEFVEQQVGFAPYWNPFIGGRFYATPEAIDIDKDDPDFIRYVLKSHINLTCYTGPADDAKEVLVKAGDYFTISAYAKLPLQKFIGVPVMAKVIAELDIGKGKTMWDFEVRVSASDDKLLRAKREELGLAALKRPSDPKAIEAKGETVRNSAS